MTTSNQALAMKRILQVAIIQFLIHRIRSLENNLKIIITVKQRKQTLRDIQI